METCSFPRIVLSPLHPLTSKNKHFQIPKSKQLHKKITPLFATLNSPKGFGPSPKKITKKSKKVPKQENEDQENDDDDDDDNQEGGVIPEIVTNRMISRMGFSVGIPLFIGLLFFPFFYYLKVGLKIDVPTWIPFIVSFIFFGTALLGVSYGIVSSSWDPMREGSTLGWNEAKKNWPVFWQSISGGGGSRKKY
ncbi:protein PAM68, chloroplastic [Solanum dulcamara]|uniref:protein PAM68, chloroplastic n=1 Tax=Solanum dulcamara TaxID=45834 RepID=UPI002484F66F|nr:protein PAM68, chloroplastic [Solanum dulcamara]